MKDPRFDIQCYLPFATTAGDTYTDTCSPSEYPDGGHPDGEYPQSVEPSNDGWEDHELQLLQPTVFQPSDDFTTRAADKPSYQSEYPKSPSPLHSNEMTFEAVPGSQPEQRATQGESRELAAMADDKAIHGNFIPVSHSHSNSRGRNKHKPSNSYETILRLSLTDDQVDKLTSVYVLSALALCFSLLTFSQTLQ